MLRVREYTLESEVNQAIGQTWAQNHAPNAKPPKPSSYSEFPSPRMATFGTGMRRVSIDENHGRPPYRQGGPLFLYKLLQPKYKVGDVHVFSRRKTASFGSVVIIPGDGSDWRLHYTGGFTLGLSSYSAYQSLGGAENITANMETSPVVNPDGLSSLGNVAYNKLRPKVEVASLGQTLAELGDLPKTLRTTGKGFHELWQAVGGSNPAWRGHAIRQNAKDKWRQAPKGAADQFLNAAFGWSPFVNDVVQTCDTVLFAADHIASRIRNNDRWLKRRFVEEEVNTETLVYSSYGNTSNMCDPVLGPDYVTPGSGSIEIRRQSMTQVWYEGSFKYYRPEFDAGLKSGYPALQKIRQMITLLGLNISPTLLYRVTPYTWLADWLVGVGGNIQLLEDLGTGQVASRYMYLMRHAYDRFEYKVKFSTYDGQTITLVWYKQAEVKRRVGAQSPFGFSMPVNGLSTFQHTILAALGISKAGK